MSGLETKMHRFMIATIVVAALLTAPAANGETLPSVPEGMEVYIMILRSPSAPQPDLASVGGVVLRSDGDRRLIAIPPGAAEALELQPGVAALQPVWTGQARPEVKPAPAPRAQSARDFTAQSVVQPVPQSVG